MRQHSSRNPTLQIILCFQTHTTPFLRCTALAYRRGEGSKAATSLGKRGGGKTSSAYFDFINITQADVTHLEGQIQVISTIGTIQVTAPIRSGILLPQESCTKHGCWNFSQTKQSCQKEKPLCHVAHTSFFYLPRHHPPFAAGEAASGGEQPSITKDRPAAHRRSRSHSDHLAHPGQGSPCRL